MKTINRFSAIYGIMSAVCMAALWTGFGVTGYLSPHAAKEPVAFLFLYAAEFLTAATLLAGGIALIRQTAFAAELFSAGLGMMLYAVIYAFGKFLGYGHIGFAVFFGAAGVSALVLFTVRFIAVRNNR